MGSEPHRVEIKIPAESEYVGVVRLAVSGLASRLNFTIDDIEDIKVAVSEACTNAVQHAYANDQGTGLIDIDCVVYDDRLEMTVRDKGIGFDTQNIVKQEVGNRHDGHLGLGLGLTFIESLMDEADVQSDMGKGSTIRMMKYLPKATETIAV